MPSYKICYFNSRGWAEMSRLALIDAGVEFEDVRYTREEWPTHKPNMLFGQMPVLFVDGEQVAHSRAALRYLGRELKMDGGDPLTAAKADMWIEVLVETIFKFPISEPDEKKKAEQSEVVFKEVLIPRMGKLEAVFDESKGVYMFGENPTVADFAAYSTMDMIRKKGAGDEFLKPFPKLKGMMDALEARPKISKWIAERPETEY